MTVALAGLITAKVCRDSKVDFDSFGNRLVTVWRVGKRFPPREQCKFDANEKALRAAAFPEHWVLFGKNRAEAGIFSGRWPTSRQTTGIRKGPRWGSSYQQIDGTAEPDRGNPAHSPSLWREKHAHLVAGGAT